MQAIPGGAAAADTDRPIRLRLCRKVLRGIKRLPGRIKKQGGFAVRIGNKELL